MGSLLMGTGGGYPVSNFTSKKWPSLAGCVVGDKGFGEGRLEADTNQMNKS